MPEAMYLSFELAIELTGVSVRTAHERMASGQWAVRPSEDVSGNGRPKSEILLTSLPPAAQIEYFRREGLPALLPPGGAATINLAEVSEKNQQKALYRHQVVKDAEGLIAAGTLPIMEIYKHVAAKYSADSPRSVERWVASYRTEGIVGLIPKTGKKGGFKVLSTELQGLIKKEWLQATQPSKSDVHRTVERICGLMRMDAPSLDTVSRYIDTIHESAATAARKGPQAWRSKFRPKVVRDPESVEVGEMWCGDHRQMDVLVRLTDEPDALIFRPWFTAWYDVRSRVCTGWHLRDVPSSRTIALALRQGIRAFGIPKGRQLPGALYVDNGKDYKSQLLNGKDFSHGKVGNIPEEVKLVLAKGALHPLGIELIHATEYSAWEKPIEQWFGHTFPQWERTLPGWTGRDAKHRPEKLKGEIDGGKLLTLEQFRERLAARIDEYHRTAHGGAKMYGKTPLALWEGRAIEKINDRALDIMLMPRKVATVTAQGIPAFGSRNHPRFYRNTEALSLLVGEKVEYHYDPDDLSHLVVFQNNRFLCVATNAELASFRPSEKQRSEAQRQIAIAKRVKEQYAESHALLMTPDDALRAVVNASHGQGGRGPRDPRGGSRVLSFSRPQATPGVQVVSASVQSIEAPAFSEAAAALDHARREQDRAEAAHPAASAPVLKNNRDLPAALLRRPPAAPAAQPEVEQDRLLSKLLRNGRSPS